MSIVQRKKKLSESALLQRAFGAVGLACSDDTFASFVSTKLNIGMIYYAYDKHDFCILEKTDSIAKLGKIAIFDNPGVYSIEAVKNPFFGVKSAEELAVRLDLMGA